MATDMLPLFPLAVVLLPHNELPLHIFEDRYKEMIGHALETATDFGVVLAADEGISVIGCTASIQEVTKRYPDGRLDIVTVGHRRFRIHSVDSEAPYLRGQVEFFEDEEPAAPANLRERLAQLALTLWPEGSFESTAPDLSFRVAADISDLGLRQQLLGSRSEADRVRRLLTFLPGYADRLLKISNLREAAPKNGHSHLAVPLDDVS